MEAVEKQRLFGLLERGVKAAERMADAMEAANKADPLTVLSQALAAESTATVTIPNAEPIPTGPDLSGQEWRFR